MNTTETQSDSSLQRVVRPRGGYLTILADPPWKQGMVGKWTHKRTVAKSLEYPTMTIEEICAMRVGELAGEGCHLWLWTTNQFLDAGFDVMRAWGFKYLAPVHWIKDSGCGAWWIHRTQTILHGYKDKCRFPMGRYKPNIFNANKPTKHSKKPDQSYDLIESISPAPRLELFARERRLGWDAWGNEV